MDQNLNNDQARFLIYAFSVYPYNSESSVVIGFVHAIYKPS